MNIRPANANDAGAMAAILSEIIAIGGTTALEGPITGDDIQEWMSRGGSMATWIVAEDAPGDIMGFQWAEPNPKLPPEAADIATFAKVGVTGRGIGSAMFQATATALKKMGYSWINASIRSDNQSGLTYYRKMGFVEYAADPTVAMADGTITGKTYKRYDL